MNVARRFRGILTVGLFLTIASTATAKYSGGSGTATNPYQIGTAADLIALGETPADYDKCFVLTADIDLAPKLPGRKVFDKAVIAPDIDPNDRYSWFQGPSFTGVFDGKGHVIRRLHVQGAACLGLFGLLRGSVSNLGVEAVDVSGTGNDVGGLVGYNIWCGSITASYSSGSVSGASGVGGLVGKNAGTIKYSYGAAVVAGDSFVGGLVGTNGECDEIACNGVISNCYSRSAVTGGAGVGGLAGANDGGYITQSFWDTQISGQTTSDGGVGKTTAEMQDPNTLMAAGWDFVHRPDGPHDIWAEPEGGGYPILWWQMSPLPELHFSGGTGTAGYPYLISTADQLNSIGHNPRLVNCHFRLVADLDLTGFSYYPIGDDPLYPYRGVFDGNGHAVSRLTLRGGSYLGLFGLLVAGAEVRNMGVVDVNIVGFGNYIGGLLGANGSEYESGGRVTHCYSTGSVSGRDFVGGLVGSMSSGSIATSSSAGSVSGEDCVGGLLGANGVPYGPGGSVANCYSSASIRGGSYVGGLVGSSKGGIAASSSTGSVSGAHIVGGLVGSNSGSIVTSYSASSVSPAGWEVGGLVGSNGGSVAASYSSGSVRGTGTGGYVGGLVGNNWGIIAAGYSTGSVSGAGPCVGGLVGSDRGSIGTSYSTGSVSGVERVGGLVGHNDRGHLIQCYSAGSVKGTDSAGGLVGYGYQGDIAGSFWDTQTSGQTTSDGGTGKTTAEMQMAKTFLDAGWDFVGETKNGTDDLWWILEGKGYPRLWWELPATK